MEFDDFVIQFSTMVLLACAAFFGVVAVAWYVNKVLEARGKRLESAQDKLDSLVGGKEINDRYLDPVGGFNKDMVQRTPDSPTPGSLVEVGKFMDLEKASLRARLDGIEAKLSKLTQASDALDHWIHKVEGQTEKLHESLVSHARDIDRLDGRIDTLAKRRAPKKRAR